ncbi:MAG: T9SS type A sorting domain-containing protein, partial [Phaeodactylibacter sp.]|nr:T9SS type A sorting domain-containing protein [Phaeodactylibacter sp.]
KLIRYRYNKVIADHVIFSEAGLSVGDEFAWSTESTALPEVVWFYLPQAKATACAEISAEDNLPTFWTVEPDPDDATNPLNHKLVIWGVHDNGLAAATDEFWAIADNSIQWVLGNISNTKETDILVASLENTPNPFSTTTQISFNLKDNADVELRVYDALGRVVSSIQDYRTSGEQAMTYTNDGLQTGMYFYSLYANGLLAGTGKMIVE